ncbi:MULTISPECIES: sodium:proton antiporter [unclassified Mesotoga]|uniref:sodium:proton antiporter n=1 Tax=unclassified Mesotoga TaxID=1184398 RepID=UPI000CCC8129|nr:MULTISPECIES: cation:proton antiporter subunit C [unclassified Mesotoga]MDD3461411.1 cation:proton antiporter subunit C [Mesotoga sp.]PNS39446.1 monovalent cation/H+ antiporter subunit C [Mesotoga sp. B105.6.4]
MIQYFSMMLVAVGLYGLLSQKNLVKLIISLNIAEIGVNLFIVSIGYVEGGAAPILSSVSNNSSLLFVDPLPQALVLTSIVIGVGVTALALSLIVSVNKSRGTIDISELSSGGGDRE